MKPTPEDHKVLGSSGCGFQGETHLVCCPEENTLKLPEPPVCGSDSQDFIYGGKNTYIDEHPWTALLLYRNANSVNHYCGGSLISSKYVLTGRGCLRYELRKKHVFKLDTQLTLSFTAAHCIQNIGSATLESVRLGEWDTSNDNDCDSSFVDEVVCSTKPIDVLVESAIAHPEYDNESRENDIALIRLAKDVEFTKFVRPICLPLTAEDKKIDLSGRNLTVVGKT